MHSHYWRAEIVAFSANGTDADGSSKCFTNEWRAGSKPVSRGLIHTSHTAISYLQPCDGRRGAKLLSPLVITTIKANPGTIQAPFVWGFISSMLKSFSFQTRKQRHIFF